VQWSRHCATNRKVAGSFRPHYGPGVDSASNRSEYQEYFLGVKAVGAQGWQPCHLHAPIVLKSGSLNLLEPSGPVKACNGIALAFTYTYSFEALLDIKCVTSFCILQQLQKLHSLMRWISKCHITLAMLKTGDGTYIYCNRFKLLLLSITVCQIYAILV
jgi:hypothetical protein